MNSTTKRNTIFGITLIVISTAGFAFTAYQIQAKGEQLDEQIKTLETNQAQVQHRHRLQQLAKETDAERQELVRYFFNEEDDSFELLDFLSQIEALAPKFGLTLDSAVPSDVVDATDKSQWIEIKLSFAGPKERVHQFIQVLENVQYVSRITGLDLQAQSSTSWKADVTMRTRQLTYED